MSGGRCCGVVVCHDERVDDAPETPRSADDPAPAIADDVVPGHADDVRAASTDGPSRTVADDWQTRRLHQRFGRFRVGIGVVVVSFWIVAPNMPSSAVRDRLDHLWEPAVGVGLVQDWAVFSPNPRSQSIDVRARLDYADGTIDFWDVPEFGPGIGAFRQYRWNKWQERVRLDERNEYWAPTAEWIAEQNVRDGEEPARVTLIRRWIDHEPLTADGPSVNVGWNEFEFFVWERDA